MESSIPLTSQVDQPDGDSFYGLVDKAAQTNKQNRSEALEVLIRNRNRRLAVMVVTPFVLVGTYLFLIVLFILVNATTTTYPQYSNCTDQGWIGYRDNCYNVSKDPLTWYEAAEFCRTINSHLAILYTSEDIVFLKTLAKDNFRSRTNGTGMWLDGTDLLLEGKWIWNTTGDIVTYSDWYKRLGLQEPNNHAGMEHCLEMRHDQNYQWNDLKCNSKNQAICQKKNNNFTSTKI